MGESVKATSRWYDRFGFNTQISAIFIFATVVVGLFTSVLLTKISSGIIYQHQIQQGIKITDFIARQTEAALLFQSVNGASDIANSVINLPDVIGINIRTHELVELFAIGQKFPEDSLGVPPKESNMVSESHNAWVFSAPVYSDQGEQSGLIGSTHEEQRLLVGFISILFAKDAQMRLINSIERNNLWAAGLLVVFLIVLMWVSNRAIRPIRALSKIMISTQGSEDLVLAAVKGPQDIAQMQGAFNSLMMNLHKRRNELKEVAQSAVALADAKGQFAANVTHELRTPLGAVLSMLDILLATDMSEKQKEYLETTHSSARSLLTLIDEVLRFSEVESGKMTIVERECHLTDILDEVTVLLASKALKKPIDIGYVISSEVPEVVITDASKLRQMLINLLGNAVKFTESGEVSIYVTQTPLSSGGEGANICFCVKDDGIGISPEDQQQIFGAFFQLDSSPTKAYEGTGLGLAIVSKVVALMGGEISVSSQLDSGSEFTLSVPVKEAKQPSRKIDSNLLRGKTFLLVAKAIVVRDFVTNELTGLGARVVVASSGREAIELVTDAEVATYQGVVIDEDSIEISVGDFFTLLEDFIDLKNLFATILINSNFSTYHLDNVQATRIAKPLKSTSLKRLLFNYFLLDPAHPPRLKSNDMAAKSAIHVLVVEDNRTNQQIVEAMLRRLGCSYEVAANGRLGVEKVVYGKFDLVLMDCNMPILSGYAATKQIRIFEADVVAQLPIIAMTANYSESDKKRCTEAGMSDFMSKPLSLIDMRNILAKWTSFKASESQELAAIEDNTGRIGLDDNRDYSGLSYDPQVFRQLQALVGPAIHTMIKDYCVDMTVYLESLKAAIDDGNASEVQYISHNIKGATKNFGADKLMQLSSYLEEQAEQGELAEAENQALKIAEAFSFLRADLTRHLFNTDQLSPKAEGFEVKGRVLVVDDDGSTRKTLVGAIRLAGFVVEEATGGLDALNICQRQMPDLILMDALMPDLDGFETCKKIRQMPNGDDIPILIISDSESEDSVQLAFSVAATDYIGKPVNVSVTRNRIEHLISSNKAERRIKRMAYHDSLTGLPNRASLMQYLQLLINQSTANKSMFAVLFLDLDHFKVINDTMGHESGDLLLKAVSERLQTHVRGQDFVARLGGDEFTVVLENIRNSQTVADIAEKICESLSHPFLFMRREMFVTTSIGISIYPDDGEDITDLMKYADSAMFSAKDNRNGFCFYDSGMEIAISKRLEMERELRKGIEQNELLLFYQPKIDFKNPSLIAAEALLRWQHPERGLLGPDEFISLAEETGLIEQLNDWVLHAGVKQLSDWLVAGYQLTLSLNLSLKGPIAQALERRLTGLINRYQLPKDCLELEITESALIDQPKLIMVELSRVRKLGVKIALDDFGSGYSSLNHLKNLPVDVLKIDRLFIRDIENDPSDSSIVKSIVYLARALKMKTVAEGVETEQQHDILKSLNCDYFQGYLASKPIDSEQFEAQFLVGQRL
jgi:diguanylate cyclase (GGDEF)-like protein